MPILHFALMHSGLKQLPDVLFHKLTPGAYSTAGTLQSAQDTASKYTQQAQDSTQDLTKSAQQTASNASQQAQDTTERNTKPVQVLFPSFLSAMLTKVWLPSTFACAFRPGHAMSQVRLYFPDCKLDLLIV